MQLTAPASPALRLAQQLAWMRDNENTPVVELIPTAPDTLEFVVRDGWFEGDKTGDDADCYSTATTRSSRTSTYRSCRWRARPTSTAGSTS